MCLTGDESMDSDNLSEEMYEKILICIEHEDEDLITDFRKLNARPEMYLDFYQKCFEIFRDIIVAEQRRQNNTYYFPSAQTPQHIIDKVKENIQIPFLQHHNI